MISFTETDGNGMSITTLYRKDTWGAFLPFCELVEVDDEWTIETDDGEVTIMDKPQGDKHEYLDALNGLNHPPIDKDKPLLSFTSGIIKFDVWEVVRDDGS